MPKINYDEDTGEYSVGNQFFETHKEASEYANYCLEQYWDMKYEDLRERRYEEEITGNAEE